MTYVDGIVEFIMVDRAQNGHDDSVHDINGYLLDMKRF